MLGLRWFNRHARWERDIDAYVDGELGEPQLALFASHLEGCQSCAAQVAEAKAMKRMLAAELTEHPVPRSFRLTPAMLAEAGPVATAASTPWWPRAAQAMGGLAVASFALLLVIDLSSNTSESFTARGSPADGTIALQSAAPQSESLEDAVSDDFGGGDEPPSSSSAGEAEMADAGNGDQGTTKGTGGVGDDSAEAAERSSGDSGSGAPVGGLGSANGAEDPGIDGLLFAQIASLLVALAAGGTYLASRRKNQE